LPSLPAAQRNRPGKRGPRSDDKSRSRSRPCLL
jgi:hypothetical protein